MLTIKVYKITLHNQNCNYDLASHDNEKVHNIKLQTLEYNGTNLLHSSYQLLIARKWTIRVFHNKE